MENLFLVLRVIVSLAVVLGLLYVLRRKLVPRAGGAGQRREISVVARQGIGAKTSVALVDVGGKRYLLGVGEQAVNVLDSYAAPVADELEPAASARGRLFALDLDDARQRGRRPATTDPLEASDDAASPQDPAAGDDAPAPLTRRDLRFGRTTAPAADGTEPGSPLAGSILSAQTWRQAAAAWRRGPS
ncbi:FliO/MopB family protein [Arthrobacter sp.]|uniref:FliO/MopB family protein n=1 Tax=Arthrobacter sp. TaxID=1667 RepID=UPI003A8FFC38